MSDLPLRTLKPLVLSLAAAAFPLLPGVAKAAAPALLLAVVDDGAVAGTVTQTGRQTGTRAKVQLLNSAGKLVAQTQTAADGSFDIRGVAPGRYTVTAADSSGLFSSADVLIAASSTAQAALVLGGTQLDEVTVTAQRLERSRNTLSPTTGSSQYVFDRKAIEQLPEGDHTPFNQLLLQAPGVANDSYGQLHVRGDHNDLQYRINGIILPEGLSGFGQVFDTRFAKSITLNTGALPAQYGLRTAGVIDIVTKDRLDGGEIDLYGGSHSTYNPSAQWAKTSGPFSAYLTGQYRQDNLGVENSTPDSNAVHDSSKQGKGFGYVSYLLDNSTKLSAVVASTASRLEIPNNPGQSANGDFVAQLDNAGFDTSGIDSRNLDDRQFERNTYGLVALQGILGSGANYQLAVFDRQSSVAYRPDVLGDLAFNGVAAQIRRKSATVSVQGDVGYGLTPAHMVTGGFSFSSENDKADNTSQVFTTDDNGAVNGGPTTIVDNNPKNGNTLASLYVQDKWEASDQLTVNYGLRYDRLDAFVAGSQLSPRIGIVDFLSPRTTLHAGYARYFTPPPNELVASSSLAKFANTTNAPELNINSPVQPERSHYFDAGLVHQLTSHITLGVDGYYRTVRNLLDEGQFGQALIFTPFNYDHGHIYGVELTSSYRAGNFSAYLNVARANAKATQVASGEFNFGADDLAYIRSHYIYLDHDQRVTVSSGASYEWLKTTYGVTGTYGTGLREDATAADGSTIPNGGKVPHNMQFNLSAARSVQVSEAFGRLDLRLAALNVLDRKNEIRDGSGVGVFAAQYGPRAAIYFGVAKPFGGL